MDKDNELFSILNRLEQIQSHLVQLKEALGVKKLMTNTNLLDRVATHIIYINNRYEAALKELRIALEENAIALLEEARAKEEESLVKCGQTITAREGKIQNEK